MIAALASRPGLPRGMLTWALLNLFDSLKAIDLHYPSKPDQFWDAEYMVRAPLVPALVQPQHCVFAWTVILRRLLCHAVQYLVEFASSAKLLCPCISH